MSTIAYDLPVKNFIAGLNKTGHVTHTKHRKTKVTIHHMAGRLSLEALLKVWETRPASAHFAIDGKGDCGQYVIASEYAWAAGNTKGNQESIHIEMANASLAPHWLVAWITWNRTARLAGWLFARVIGERPTKNNLVVHHYWKPTVCAGPYVDKIYNDILKAAQGYYDEFTKGEAPEPTPGKTLSQLADEVIAGYWSSGDERKRRLRAAGYSYEKVQGLVNQRLGSRKSQPSPKPMSLIVSQVLAGSWGNGEERARRLTAAGHDANAVQAEVNRRLSRGAPAAHRPSTVDMARQVIAGQWGDGIERKRRLEGAGYNYREVQDEVNRLLR